MKNMYVETSTWKQCEVCRGKTEQQNEFINTMHYIKTNIGYNIVCRNCIERLENENAGFGLGNYSTTNERDWETLSTLFDGY